MRIGEKYDSNHKIAAVKILCQKYGRSMPERDTEYMKDLLKRNSEFFVFINKSGVEIQAINERSDLLGVIVYNKVKRGKVLFFHDFNFTEVDRNNIKRFLTFIMPKRKAEGNDRIRVPKREISMFEEAQIDPPNKKRGRNRGFKRTFMANSLMNNIHTPIVCIK